MYKDVHLLTGRPVRFFSIQDVRGFYARIDGLYVIILTITPSLP